MPIGFTLAGTFGGNDVANSGVNLNNPTSLQFGPDERLYVSEQNGSINAFTVEKQGDDWVATDAEELVLADGSGVVKSIQNHNDDGSESGNSNRQVTGIVVTEDDQGNVVLYVSSSDPRISSNNDIGLDTNSGVVSKVTQTETGGWEVVDLVRGLPRSEENHSVNGMILTEDGTKLLLQVGGFTNNGAPSSFFSYTNEYVLSGATLELDLVALDALPDQIDPEGGQGNTPRTYKYDLPTLDDPNIENVTDGVGEDANGMDENGPFGGNDGLNMAILPSDAPLRLYADGTRNAYDLAQGANGLIYTVDNGSNGNLGADPNTENTDDDGDGIPNEAIGTPNNGGQGEGEPFHQIVEGGYYYHANPVRSNQNMEWTVYGNNGQPDPNVSVNNVADISARVPTILITEGTMTPGFLIDPRKFAAAPGQTLQDLIDLDALDGGTRAQERLALSGQWINSNQLDNIADPDGSGSGQTTIAQLGSSTNGIIVYDSGGAAFGGSIDGAVFVTQFNDNLTLLNVNDLGTDLEPLFEEGPDGIFGTADDVVQDADGILQVANNSTGVPLGNPLDVTQGPGGTLWVAEIGSNEISVLEPTVALDPTSEDADFDGILNKDDPFSRDATNGTSVTVNAAAPTVWEFSQGAGDTTPGPDGFGGGLTGAMIDGQTDFEAFYLQEDPNGNPGDLFLDNVKFVTAAAGGTTTIEEVSNGDPFLTDNDGKYLFHTGFVLDEAVETFTVTWVVANPGAIDGGSDITNSFQQIGGYLGDGTQSNYLKIVAIATNDPSQGTAPTANIQIALEEDDALLQPSINLPANGIFDNANLEPDSSITFELLIDLMAKTATPTATYVTNGGQEVTISGDGSQVIDLAPGGQDSKVLTTFLGGTALPGGEQQGIAAGLFSSNTNSNNDTFQAVFDSITVSATEGAIPPVAADDDVTTQTNNAIEIPVATLLANDTDANTNEVLTVTGVSNAVNGAVALTNGVVTFTPEPDFQGDATFEYTVEDSTGLTDTGLVTVSVSDLTVLFRLNAAGDTIAALPNDPYGSDLEWLGLGTGGGTAPSGTQSGFEWSVTSTNTSVHNISGRDASVPAYVPQELFAAERWDPGAAPDMQWTFGNGDLPNGTYTVNIFAGNGFGGTSAPGQRVFDIEVEGELAFDNVDLSDQFGHQTGGLLSYEVQVADGTLNVELGRDGVDSVENPTINAIEILQGSVAPQMPTIDIVSGDVIVNEDAGIIQVSVLTSETVPAGPGLAFTYVITGVTANQASDYQPIGNGNSAGSVFTSADANIAGSSSDFTIDIDITDDSVFENAETFTVEITSVGPGFEIGNGLATITIADDDAAQSIADANDATGTDGEDTLEYTGTEDGDITLNPEVENIELNTTANVNVVANEFENTIAHGAGVNVVDGKEGDDTFTGTSQDFEGDTILNLEGGDKIVVEGASSLSFVGATEGSVNATFNDGNANFTITFDGAQGPAFVDGELNGEFVINNNEIAFVENVASGAVLYRINAGGPQVATLDDGPDWSADTGNIGDAGNSPFLVSTSTGTSIFTNASGSSYAGDVTSAPGVSSDVPLMVFDTERYDPNADAPPLAYQFNVLSDHGLQPGDQVEVRLYFAEIFSGVDAAGERVFDVSVDGITPPTFDDIDAFAETGAGNVGLVRTYVATVDADGILDIEFAHDVAQNPAIKAIEIVAIDNTGPTPAVLSIGAPTPDTVLEGDGLTLLFPVTFDKTPNEAVTVEYVVSINGIEQPVQSLVLGTSDGTIEVPVTNDEVNNGDDTVTVTLTGITVGDAAADIGTAAAAATVTEDDAVVEPPEGTAIYRINSGGPKIVVGDDDDLNASDPDLDWAADQNPNPNSALVAGGENTFGTSGVTIDTSGVPDVPAGVFNNERFDFENQNSPFDMQYEFAVDPGTYTVKLYIAEGFGGNLGVGNRIFDVAVEGDVPTVFNDIDPSALSQAQNGTDNFNFASVLSYTLEVIDGTLDIDFAKITENPAIRGIEILAVDTTPPYEPPVDDLFGTPIEIADAGDSPSGPVDLVAGSNIMSATQEGEGDGLNGVRDRDYFTVSVPEGFQLTGVELKGYENTNTAAPDGFLAFQQGPEVTVNPETGENVDQLQGAIIYGASDVDTDLLATMRGGFDNPGGSQTLPAFDQPLTGELTFWLNQGAGPSTATLDFIVEPLPVELSIADAPTLVENGDVDPTTLEFAVSASDPTFSGQVTLTFDQDSLFGLTQVVTFTEGVATLSIAVPSDDADNGDDTVSITLTGANDGGTTLFEIDATADTASGVVTEDDGGDPNDIDGDGLANIVDPAFADPTNGLSTVLSTSNPIVIDFETPGSDPFDAGFAGINVNPDATATTDASDPYGAFTSNGVVIEDGLLKVTTSNGDSFNQNNASVDDYGVMVDARNNDSFSVKATLITPVDFTDENFQAWGIQIGDGTQESYVKFTRASGDKLQVRWDDADALQQELNTGADGVPALTPEQANAARYDLELLLTGDGQGAWTAQAVAQAFDASDAQIGGDIVLGEVSLSGEILSAINAGQLYAGIYSTDFGNAPTFTAQWADFSVVSNDAPPAPSGGAATLTINDGANGIETSNFGSGSFSITNTGTKDISFIEIDVTDALFPDAVFDPFGIAGDTIGQPLTLQGGSDGGTGLIEPAGGFYIGSGGVDGFETIRLEFTNFNPGDTISFGVDMDPNSIAGAQKGTLDSGAGLAGAGGNNLWDVGGIGGAELSGSLFKVGYTDDTTSEGKLLGQGTGSQMGAVAQSSQDSPNLAVVLTVNGLAEGEEGTYTDGGPEILIQGPEGETARVLVSKGFIVPFTNEFTNAYAAQLDAQLAALEASGFPANNAVEMLYVDVPLDGSVQDISSLFDFTQVAGFDLSVPDATNEFGVLNEAQLPLGIVASVIDTSNGQPLGPVTSPVHLTYAENATPEIAPITDLTIDEGATAQIDIAATDAESDPIALSVTLTRDIDGTEVDPADYAFTDNGDGTGSFSWLTGEPDDGTYTLEVTASDGNGETTVTAPIIVNELPDPAPGTVLYRVNAGGPELAAIDGGPAWSADTDGNPSEFLTSIGSGNTAGFPVGPGPTVPSTVPDALFSTERWDAGPPGNPAEMQWAFDVADGVYEVRIYAGNGFNGTSDPGTRVFDISIEDTIPPSLDDIDLSFQFGHQVGGLLTEVVEVTDGTLNIDFLHDLIENPLVNGIEILVAGDADTTPPSGTLTASDVTATATAYQFTVTFSDASGIDVSTLDNLDVTISNGDDTFVAAAELVSVDVPADGTPRTATYQVTPPGGEWTAADNGTYDVVLNAGQVADLFGNTDVETTLGTFVVDLPEAAASATLEITPDGGLGASTFGGGSFQLSNTSEPGVQITSVSINLSTGILPDMVFDPTGSGGDATASALTANSGAAETGFVAPTDPAVDPFSQARNGGFDVLDIAFTDFDPGEQFNFTTDVDPNNIQGVPGAGAAGAVSGYELAGATVTITFSNGETLVGSLFEDGSLGGGQVLLDQNTLVAPTIEVLGAGADESPSLPGAQVTVSGDPVIRVSGTPGDDIALLQMDSRLFIASGAPPFDVAPDELPFYANEAMAGKAVYTDVIGPSGFVDIPVAFLTTNAASGPDGGLNQFIAVSSDGPYTVDAATSSISNTLTVKQGVPLIYDAPGLMEFDGTSSSVIELPHDPDWEVPSGTIAFSFNADNTNGEQGLMAKDAKSFSGGGNHFAAYLDGDTLTARVQDGSSSTTMTFDGILAGEEYEVAVTFGPDGAGLWVDGNLVDTTELVMDWTQNEEFVQWGALGWRSQTGEAGFELPFSGTISDKQIYGGELTASQIAALAGVSSGTNANPTPVDDEIATTEDIPVSIDVATLLSNDSDPDGDTPVFGGIATQPANGSAVYNGTTGEITYTPDPDFNGTDSFDITVEDGAGGSAQSTVTVDVAAVNDDPVATDDVATVIINGSVTIDLLANDDDVDGDTLSVVSIDDSGVSGGTVTNNGNGTITYVAGETADIEDMFSYTVSDGNGGTNVGSITVAVLGEPNVDPSAENDPSYAVDEDGSLLIAAGAGVLANDSDPNGDPLTAAVVNDVSNGALSLAEDGSFVYTPDPDFFGTDQFDYLASDGLGGTDQATATIEVTPVNDDPVAVDDDAQTAKDTAVEINVLDNDADVDGDTLTIVEATNGAAGTVQIAPDNSSLTYTPAPGSTGLDSFTYTVEDEAGARSTATVQVDVSDEAIPDLLYDVPGLMEFDGTSSSVIELPHDAAWEVPAGTIAFSFNADNTDGEQGLMAKDAKSFSGGGNHFAAYLDGDTLTARVQDGSSSTTMTFDGIVAGEEYEVAVTFGPDGAGLWVDGNLVDTTELVMDWTQNEEFVQWGALGWRSQTGEAGFELPFSGTISDKQIYGGELTASQIAALAGVSSGTNANPTPVDDEIATTEDTPVSIDVATLLSNDSDPDGDTPVFGGIATQPANGSAVYNGTTGEITYTPDPDFNGTDSFDITVEDGAGGSAQSTVTVDVAAVNDDPVATDDVATVIINGSVTIDLLANDDDVDGDTLSVVSIDDSGVSGGTVTNNGNGTITYVAGETADIEDMFSYTVSDGNGGTNVGSITVAVLGEPNVDPSAENDPSYAVDEDGSLLIAAGAGVLANDSDPNGDPLTAAVVNDVSNGALSLAEDGSFVYTPDPDFFGTDQFDYLASDGLGGTDQATATIEVTPVNDDPVAVDDDAQTAKDTAVEINVLDNDADVDGDTLTIVEATNGAAGTVQIAPDNSSLTYTPAPGSTGLDSFTYTVEDEAGARSTATVQVDVRDTEAPVFEQAGVETYSGIVSDIDNYAPSSALNIAAGTIAFSFIADSFGGDQGLVAKDAKGFSGGGNHFAAYLDGDDLFFRFQDGAASQVFSADNLNTGQEYELAAVFGPDGVAAYVDGALIGESDTFVMNWESNDEWLNVGGLGWRSQTGDDAAADPFSGSIADLQIFDDVLSDAEIATLADGSSFDFI